MSTIGPDGPGVTEYPRTQHHWEQVSGSSFGSSLLNDIETADGTVLAKDTDHMAISAPSISGGKDAHNVAYEASNIDDMLVDVSASCHGTSIGAGDRLPAQDPVSDTDGHLTESVEPECRTSITGSGSATSAPSLLSVPDTSGVSSEVTSLPRSHVDTGHDPSLGQTGRIVDNGIAQAGIPINAPPACEDGPIIIVSSSLSFDNVNHLSPCAGNSLEATIPLADPDATLTQMQDALTSSLNTISGQIMPTTTAWHASQASSSMGPSILSSPTSVSGMCSL